MARTALITGGSSGIGYELARLFAADGYQLVLVARSRDALQHAAAQLTRDSQVAVEPLAIDLSAPGAPKALFQALGGRPIDVLVNNAAFGVYGPFLETPLDDELAMLRLNVSTLTELSKLFGREMAARRSGRILNVASTAAFQPGPLMAVYYASKAYVLSFSQALSHELARSGVSVSVLCPGPTDTGFGRRAGMERSRLFDANVMDAATVARIGYRGLMRNTPVIVAGLQNRVWAVASRLIPRRLLPVLVERVQRPHGDRSSSREV
jgi:uncharacterized protein